MSIEPAPADPTDAALQTRATIALPLAATSRPTIDDVALDLGTTAFRSLRWEDGRLVGRREAAVYTVVPRRPEPQRLLAKAGVPFSRCQSGLVVAGQAALQVAASFDSPIIPLIPGGELPESDPVGRQVAAVLLDAVLGDRESLRGRLCFMTVPGAPAVGEQTPSLLFFTQLVSLAGLTPQVVHAGSAVAAATFADGGLRGVGVSFGASHLDVSILVRGYETGWHRVPIGGDELDARLVRRHAAYIHDRSGQRFPDYLAVRRWKAAADRSLLGTNPAERTLADGYGDLALSAAEAVADLLARHREPGRPRPLPLVASGGPTMIAGFESLWTQALRRSEVLSQLAGVELQRDADYEVARGLLLLAEAGARRPSLRSAA